MDARTSRVLGVLHVDNPAGEREGDQDYGNQGEGTEPLLTPLPFPLRSSSSTQDAVGW